MQTESVSGIIKTVALRLGSSGQFLGDIRGPYEGYRVGNPEEQEGVIEFANGSITFALRHEIAVTRQRGENPFAAGKDPFEDPPPGGPPLPPGVPRHFREGTPANPPPGGPAFQKIRRLRISVDGGKSTGIYAGACGEMEVTAPGHKETGYLVVASEYGDLRLDFCEWVEGGRIVADLKVDGGNSTGVYRDAAGDLKFALDVHPAGLASGPYWGTLRLGREWPKRTNEA